ncbi:GMC family oxidoreductase N-terminal domain-containing protein [Microbacterium sp. NEAU-LLC]|uniref:GMC family oxidoreductase N-terminal domain-containing protein n=1 Tax=Microbacterium helvum TaxID=2773713 RepID=A0ABR8NSF9_9MICO|nr:GMC oxidoreductase [Microbacterium helvum]MBD3943557.1 GMC family oxidoreductase N-terminal domain-containing protein [Microbacterium helvum]
MPAHPVIAVVGSGPIGSAYARVLLEELPDARVVMFEAGPQLTPRPGASVRNIADPEAKALARQKSQGPQSGALRASLGIPEGVVVEGMFTARQGTHLLDFGGEGSAHAAQFPAAAAATNVGGQGAHWTCAIPRPAFSEKIPFIDDDEWEELVEAAEGLLHHQAAAFADSPIGGAIRTLLDREFGAVLPDGYGVGTLPVAGDPQPDGSMVWAGADMVLGPLIEAGTDEASRFELRDLTLVRRIEHEGGVVSGVTVEDLRTGQTSFVAADLVVVAADAFRSPQLLWASGIRPAALGRYLTEHHVVITTIALDADRMGGLVTDEQLESELARRSLHAADPVAAVNRIPFSEPDHPYSLQVMYAENPPFQLDPSDPQAGNRWGYVNMGYGVRKHPRVEDGVTFSDEEVDYRGFPNFTIEYELTDAENAEISAATARLRRAGAALGAFVAPPRLLPNGSSLHYMGTMRMGTVDDGTSVADPWSRVWSFDNLVVGGNALIPTANTMNPTLTSVAIAVRGARAAAARLRAEE